MLNTAAGENTAGDSTRRQSMQGKSTQGKSTRGSTTAFRCLTAGILATVASSFVLTPTSASGADVTPNSAGEPATAHTATDRRPPFIPLPGPGHFKRHVTNRFMPWMPGHRWVYRGFGSEGGERDVVEVLDRTREIEGITATVVRDVVRDDEGHLVERTFDWYAQDDRRRVWYLGENTHAYEHGHVSTEGSWEAGVDGARAGLAMPGRPRLNTTYWQEFYRGVAEDQGKLIDRSVAVSVGDRLYERTRMTKDTTPLEPDVSEFKFYAPHVGVVLELDVSPEQGRVQLVRMTTS